MNNFDSKSFERGQGYVENVRFCFKKNEMLIGDVIGTHVYRTKYDLQKESGTCSCPVGYDCKHCVALYLNYKRGNFVDISSVKKELEKLEKQDLINLLIKNIDDIPELARKILDKAEFEKGFEDFLKNILVVDKFCLADVDRISNLIDKFNFNDLYKIYMFLKKNEHAFAEKIEGEYYDRMSNDPYSHYNDDYSEPLEDLRYDVENLLFESVSNIDKANVDLLNEDIIDNQTRNQFIMFDVFGDKIPNRNLDSLEVFRKYLIQKLMFPFYVECHKEVRDGYEDFEMKVNKIDEFIDDKYGIFFKGKISRKNIMFPVADEWDYLKGEDENKLYLEAFSDWFWNYN